MLIHWESRTPLTRSLCRNHHTLARTVPRRAQEKKAGLSPGIPPIGGKIGGVDQNCACRCPAHYAGCSKKYWDLFEYLLVWQTCEYGGALHTVLLGLDILAESLGRLETLKNQIMHSRGRRLLVNTHRDRKMDPGAAALPSMMHLRRVSLGSSTGKEK